jgi:hypothetical protein
VNKLTLASAEVQSPPDAAARAQEDLIAARERLVSSLEALERGWPALDRLRHLVRTRPALTLGGAFLLGWGLARLLRKR